MRFHGSAYEYNRVSALSANTFQNDSQGTPKSVFTRNDFGYSLGGPVIKNKLFFFNNTEWIRVRSAASQSATIIDPASVASLAPASQAYFTAYGKLATGVRVLGTGPCLGPTATTGPTCDAVSYTVRAMRRRQPGKHHRGSGARRFQHFRQDHAVRSIRFLQGIRLRRHGKLQPLRRV